MVAAVSAVAVANACSSELFATRRARRLQLVIGVAQFRSQHFIDHRAPRGQVTVAVEPFAEELERQGVDHHVPGARIEGDDGIRPGSGGNGCQVADAADVLQHAPAFAVSEHRVIQQRNQRRALATGQHVRRAKVRNHGNPGRRGNHRRLA
jgi:hypothetical protein